MRKRMNSKLLLTLGILLGVLLHFPVQVVANDWRDQEPFTLTYHQISSTEGRIDVKFNTGTKRVVLPDGTTVYQNTSFKVWENGVYDFVAYNDKGQPLQRSFTVQGLDVDHAPLFTAHGLYVKVDVEAFDTLSGLDAYRYRVAGSNWSSWIPWQNKKTNEVRIPTTSNQFSFHEEREIEVEFRDVAGNIRKTESRIRLDHRYPEIVPFTQTIYTKTGDITLPLETTSYFKEPDTLIVQEDGKSTTIDLTKIDHKTTLLGRRPNIYRSDWENNIQYKVQPIQGMRELALQVVKTYRDFKGNTVQLSSDKNSRYVINVVFDSVAPTGTIWIQSENNEVLSREVLIDLTYSDATSGVKSVRVYDDQHERYLTEEQVRAGKATIPWTLSRGKDAVVYMEVTDKAGNKATFVSNPVTVSNITIDNVTITKVINPATYKNGNVNGRSMPYNMIPGGSFSFKVKYGLGEVSHERFEVTGQYRVQIVDKDDLSNILYEETLPFENRLSDGYGFSATFPLPRYYTDDAGSERAFETGDLVLLSITLKRTEIATGRVLTTDILPNGSNIMLIGKINPGGGSFIDSFIRFNELN